MAKPILTIGDIVGPRPRWSDTQDSSQECSQSQPVAPAADSQTSYQDSCSQSQSQALDVGSLCLAGQAKPPASQQARLQPLGPGTSSTEQAQFGDFDPDASIMDLICEQPAVARTTEGSCAPQTASIPQADIVAPAASLARQANLQLSASLTKALTSPSRRPSRPGAATISQTPAKRIKCNPSRLQPEHLSHLEQTPPRKQQQQQQQPQQQQRPRRPQVQQRSQRQPQAQSVDEDVERRLNKKENAIAAIKRKREYIVYKQQQRQGTVKYAGVPSTPDPKEAVSKRTWESKVMKWRTGLKRNLAGTEGHAACEVGGADHAPAGEDDEIVGSPGSQ